MGSFFLREVSNDDGLSLGRIQYTELILLRNTAITIDLHRSPVREPVKMKKRPTNTSAVPNKRKRLEHGDVLKLLRTGNDLLSKGHTDDLIRICNDALRQVPGQADIVHLQFRAFTKENKYSEALRVLHKWGKHPASQNILTQYMIGYGYYQAKRFKSAHVQLTRVLETKPDMVGVKLLMARALSDAGHKKHALELLTTGPAVNATKPQDVMAFATVLAELEKYQESKSVLTKLMQNDLLKVECLYDLIRLPTATWSREACDLVTELLRDSTLPVRHKIKLNFSAGRIADHQGRYSDAVQSFSEAKKLSTIDFDFDRFGKTVTACTSAQVTAISCPPARTKKPPAVTPIFIIGLPRSGKTMLENLLAETTGFAACGEISLRMFVDADIFIGPQWQLPPNYAERLASMKSTQQQLYARQYIEQVCDQFYLPKTTKYIINTMPHNFLNIGTLHKLFPSSKFIYVKRNHYDIFTFCYMKNFKNEYNFTRDFDTFMRYYSMFEKVVSHWQNALSANFSTIEFEAMVRSPVDTLNRLHRFLDADMSGQMAVTSKAGASDLSDRYIGYWKNYWELFPLQSPAPDDYHQ